MNNRCLICSLEIEHGQDYHPHCSRSFFGSFPPPAMEISLGDIQEFAAKAVLERITVTGVQKKLSLGIQKKGKDTRFTIVGLWGNYILKPPIEEYEYLPENEFTTMGLAAMAGIPVVPYAMIRLASGELAYISKRIDRDGHGGKIAMEDFCQIAGRTTEDKYKGSLERVGRLLRSYSVFPGLDAVDLFERAVLSYVCGNADMHLKNYSLIYTPDGMRLSPAYDLVSTMLVIPDDTEESALTINGKKSNLEKYDFDAFADYLEIPKPARQNVYKKIIGNLEKMCLEIRKGFLPEYQQNILCGLISKRILAFESVGDI